jgi:hypothetical protein
MGDQNTNTTPAPEQQTPAGEKPKKPQREATEADKASKAIFATAAERDAVKPDNPNYKPAECEKDGCTFYTWADGYASAYTQFGKHFGLKVSLGGGKRPVKATPDDVASAFGKLSPEDQAILIRRFVPAPAAPPADQSADQSGAGQPAPETGRGRRGKRGE